MDTSAENQDKIRPRKSDNARETLNWVSLFLGELRDGLTMINMQSAFLISSKQYSEKQAGILFFVFGLSQFLFQTPAGYIMDYSDKKVSLLSAAAIGTTAMTVLTAATAKENGANLGAMVLVKFLQGGITALIPPGLNSITQGIVGSVGMTRQVSRNEMMNHMGTALIVGIGSVLAAFLYPNIGPLFVVSPIACAGVVFFLCRIKPHHIDHDAARGLVSEAEPEGSIVSSAVSSYKPPQIPTGEEGQQVKKKDKIQNVPSFIFGFRRKSVENTEENTEETTLHADTPLDVLRDTTLLVFTIICFLFHTANGAVLPLTMQCLAIGGGRTGILMSGSCIIVAQTVMVASAKICGDYSQVFGRKPLFLAGLFSVAIRCALLVGLLTLEASGNGGIFLDGAILSTQVIDGVGAGVFGTMYVLVTSDISGGTGRFSLTLGVTTAAMSIGGTVSGYLGEMLAEDFGYRAAFIILGTLSLIPSLLYLLVMPETLPTYLEQSPSSKKNVKGLAALGSMASLASIGEEDENHSSQRSSSQVHEVL